MSPARTWEYKSLRCANANVEHDGTSLSIMWINGISLRLYLAQCRQATVHKTDDGGCDLVLVFGPAANNADDSWKDRVTVSLHVTKATSLDAHEFAELLTRTLGLPSAMPRPVQSADGRSPRGDLLPGDFPDAEPAEPSVFLGPEEQPPDVPEELGGPGGAGMPEQSREGKAGAEPCEPPLGDDPAAELPFSRTQFTRAPFSEEWVNLTRDRDCADLYHEVLERLRLPG
jgi:hypothetical protein